MNTPPTFIFQTNEDSAVPAENSVHYFLALRQAGVAAEMHVFERGPHGVGLANDNAALSLWSTLLANWLRGRGVINYVGNGVAAIAIAAWERDLDVEGLNRHLAAGPDADFPRAELPATQSPNGSKPGGLDDLRSP